MRNAPRERTDGAAGRAGKTGMKTIGITGGAGAGKTEVLSYIEKKCRCRILLADSAAHAAEAPGQPCYEKLTALLGPDATGADGFLDKKKMAARIFADGTLREQVNAIVHPAVKQYILSEIESERKKGRADVFFVEAALLIEEGYGQLLDELWYIYADREIRRRRLSEERGYPAEKIDGIFASQLSEKQFFAACKTVIDNSGDLPDTYRQIDEILKEAGLYR